MRIFLSFLILIFSFQPWTKADDIRDFEIEGMSLGDSALNFLVKETLNTIQKITIKIKHSHLFKMTFILFLKLTMQ